VQAVASGGVRRLYSRTGDDISGAFPDLLEALDFDGALDGELLVIRDGVVAPFAELQKRLNRKTVSARLIGTHPAFLRAYDLLAEGGEDLRPLPFATRRARLEASSATLGPRIDLSPLVEVPDCGEPGPAARRPARPGDRGADAEAPRQPLSGRPPERPLVQVEARPQHGRRGADVCPARARQAVGLLFGLHLRGLGGRGAAGAGRQGLFRLHRRGACPIDRFVRDNTVERFGPVRAVRAEPGHGLVLEVAFEGLNRSTRHRSGVAMRFPRIARLRWDKPPAEADRLETLRALLPAEAAAA
jgi:DNA ligase 1